MASSAQPQALPNPLHPSFLDRLDADFIAFYNENIAIKPATDSIPITEIRAHPEKYAAPWCHDYSGEPFVTDVKIRSDDGYEFTIRCYEPDPQTSPFETGPYPVHVNFHGGGFTFGDLTTDADLCMLIRNRVGIMVVDVDYRLTPENTYLRGHDDAWKAINWVREHSKELNIRPDSMSIGGISAGGHMSAVAQQLARDAKIDLKLAIISVASTSHLLALKSPSEAVYPSFLENEFAPWLSWKRLKYFIDLAQPKSEAEKAEIENRPLFFKSPLDGDLRGVCTTFVVTAECDPVRDEGEAYAQRLVEAGVLVTVRRYNGVPHPFMAFSQIQKAKIYFDDVCGALKKAHGA